MVWQPFSLGIERWKEIFHFVCHTPTVYRATVIGSDRDGVLISLNKSDSSRFCTATLDKAVSVKHVVSIIAYPRRRTTLH
jgi:hypothetical protein